MRAEHAIDALYDKVNLLEDALGSGDTIEEAITKAGGKLDIATDIDRQGQTIEGLPAEGAASELLQDEAIVDLIWDSELNEVSVIQEVVMCFLWFVLPKPNRENGDLKRLKN